jgi:hypothetical protein
MNIFQKQLRLQNKSQAELAVEYGWYGENLLSISIPKNISIEKFESIMRYDEEDDVPEDTQEESNGEETHSDDWGDSEEEQGFDDDERD